MKNGIVLMYNCGDAKFFKLKQIFAMLKLRMRTVTPDKYHLTLEQLAEEAHMNKYYLSHAFKREYGVSPIHYMIGRRIEESKYLLAETDLSMSQIAQLLGFSSLSYFSQVFRRTQSLSPMEYRQSSRTAGSDL